MVESMCNLTLGRFSGHVAHRVEWPEVVKIL